MRAAITLGEHLLATGDDRAAGLGALGQACKQIARRLARAALLGELGGTGETNIHGETAKKLTLWATSGCRG